MRCDAGDESFRLLFARILQSNLRTTTYSNGARADVASGKGINTQSSMVRDKVGFERNLEERCFLLLNRALPSFLGE